MRPVVVSELKASFSGVLAIVSRLIPSPASAGLIEVAERGTIFLVEVNPERYVEHGRFDQPHRSGQRAWPHPVIANGKLYIRDQDVLLCYDVKAK